MCPEPALAAGTLCQLSEVATSSVKADAEGGTGDTLYGGVRVMSAAAGGAGEARCFAVGVENSVFLRNTGTNYY